MEKNTKTRCQLVFAGLGVGALNGLLGTGGGILAVDLLKRMKLAVKDAHATALLVTLPLSVLSACLYFFSGHGTIGAAWVYLPGGLCGAVAGAFLLNRIPSFWLKKAFALLMIYSGVRLLLR